MQRQPSSSRVLVLAGAAFLLAAAARAQGWVPQSCPVQADLHAVELLDAATGWIAGGNGTILHSTDGGSNWTAQDTHTTYALRGLSFLDASFGLAVGEGGTILRTVDGGANWSEQETGVSAVLRGIDCVGFLVGSVIGAGGTILRTTTGGVDPASTPGEASGIATFQVSPNPFFGATTFRVVLDDLRARPFGFRGVDVCDASGRRVRHLALSPPSGGMQVATWDAMDANGKRASAGVYFLCLDGEPVHTQRVIQMK